METINLRDYYPFYTSDCFIDVSDEIADVFMEFKRQEADYQRRKYYHKAQYSLDRDDGIERDILFVSLSPEEIYERKVTTEQFRSAIVNLPEKQAKRIYAYFFLGMSKAAIAQAEHVGESAVRDSIERGLRNIKIFLKKYF